MLPRTDKLRRMEDFGQSKSSRRFISRPRSVAHRRYEIHTDLTDDMDAGFAGFHNGRCGEISQFPMRLQ